MIRDLIILFIHLIATVFRLCQPGGARSVIAESLLLKHQLIVLNCPRQRAPALRPRDRVITGLCAAFISPARLLRSAIVEMKRRNPRFGYQRIADQIILVFDIEIDKDTVRRVLANHYRPEPGSGGPSWLTFLGHSKDSLWSIDLFRCESLILKSHWVMVVMDQFTRQFIGFAEKTAVVSGILQSSTCSPIARRSDTRPTSGQHLTASRKSKQLPIAA